ncbi:MAG: hypothetical protein ACE15B_04670 [Bryobacteraceae bacterium]
MFLWVLGLGLELLLIHQLLRGAFRRFPLIFAYVVTLFLTTVVEIAGQTAARHGARELARRVRLYYWINDGILQALIFGVVIALIYRALPPGVRSAGAKRLAVLAGVLTFVLSFLVHHGPRIELNQWMTLVSRDLSFAAAILDLILWTILVVTRRHDRELLALSGALGVQFAGSAVGQSLRTLAMVALGRNRTVSLIGSLLVVISHLMCLYIWFQTFRSGAHKNSGSRGAQDPL